MANVYEIITERMIKLLEAGTIPWRKTWSGGSGSRGVLPKSFASGKTYRGINAFLLMASGFDSPLWLTFNQAKERGASVRKGERGTPVIFWAKDWQKKNEETGEKETVKRMVLRYYAVFNVAQIDGLEIPADPSATPITTNPFSPIPACAAVVDAMPKRPPITHNEQRAYYRPSTDSVNMPKPESFTKAEEYYSTLFHELTHATGHKDRVGRKGIDDSVVAPFGSAVYSQEELVAEMGAAFLCGHCGIDAAVIDNSASYIAGWLKQLKGDPKMVVMAGAQAQKAADFILNVRFGEKEEE